MVVAQVGKIPAEGLFWRKWFVFVRLGRRFFRVMSTGRDSAGLGASVLNRTDECDILYSVFEMFFDC